MFPRVVSYRFSCFIFPDEYLFVVSLHGEFLYQQVGFSFPDEYLFFFVSPSCISFQSKLVSPSSFLSFYVSPTSISFHFSPTSICSSYRYTVSFCINKLVSVSPTSICSSCRYTTSFFTRFTLSVVARVLVSQS